MGTSFNVLFYNLPNVLPFLFRQLVRRHLPKTFKDSWLHQCIFQVFSEPHRARSWKASAENSLNFRLDTSSCLL